MNQSDFMNTSSDVEISPRALFKAVFKKLWIIILVSVLVGSLVFFSARGDVSRTFTTCYKNYFYIENTLIEAKDGSLASVPCSTDVNSIMQIYSYIATNDKMLQQILDSSNLDLTLDNIRSMISVETDSSSSIITVTVSGDVAEEVFTIAELLNPIVAKEITGKIDCIRIETLVNPSMPELHVVSKNAIKTAVMASLLIVIFSIIAIVIVELVQDKVKNPQQLEERFGIAVLGTVPDAKSSLKTKYARNSK